MKKTFLFLWVALLMSLTMNATAVTRDISLSGFAPYDNNGTFNSSTLVYSAIPAWGAGQIWIGDDNSYALDANGWSYIGLDLATAAANNVALTVEYTTAEATSSQTMEMKAGQLSQLMKLNGRYIKKIEIKNYSSVSDAEISLAKLYLFNADGVSEETILLNESRDLGNWTWDNRIVLASSVFNAVHEGDELVVTYTTGASGQCVLRIQDLSDGSNYLNEAGEYADVAVDQSTPADLIVVLRESDITALQAHGLYISGNDMAVSQVKLVTYAAQMMVETELNRGEETIDWSAHWEHTSGLPVLSEGDELRVVLSAKDESNDYQIYFKYDWEAGHEIGVTGIDATLPKVYSVVLTADQATAINTAGKLFVNGTGVTLSRFSIAQPMSIYDESILWSGEQAVTNGWSGNVTIAKEALADIKEGNIICVQLSAVGGDDADDQVLLKYGDSWTDFSPAANYLFQANSDVAPMTVEIPVTAKMRDQLRGNKLVVTGKDFTMTHVFIKEGTPVNTVSHFLTVTDLGLAEYNGMSTLIVPFDVPVLPDGVKAYSLSNDGSADIVATEVENVVANKPVLIVANAGEYEFVSEANASDNIGSGTFINGALVGTYSTINLTDNDGAGNTHYVLQKQSSNVAFFRVGDNVTIAPYHAYLSSSYNASTPSAPMRLVFHRTPTDVEHAVELENAEVRKVIRDGQIVIIRNGEEYNIAGQIIK